MSAAAAATPPPPAHPIAIPHFRNLWIGATISILGDQFYLVAMPWLVLQLTGSSLALGTILMAAAIPRAALMLVGGAVIDRVSARRVVMATAAARAALVGVVAALAWTGAVRLWHLYLLTFAFGVADAFSFPAGAALIPTLVEARQLPAANALLQISAVSAQMVGPAPAGLLIRRWGIAPALAFDAASFLAVLAAIVGLPAAAPPPPTAPAPGAAGTAPATAAAARRPRPGMLHDIAEGLRAVRQDPPLRLLMAVYAVFNLCVAGPMAVGLPALVKQRFGSAATFGSLLTCFGAGTLAGVALAAWVKHPRKRGLLMAAVGIATGLELLAIGLAPARPVIGGALALMGLGLGAVDVQFISWLQGRVDRAVLGRVMSVLILCAVGLVPVSYAIAGALAAWSPRALFAGAGALLLATAAVAASRGAARGID